MSHTREPAAWMYPCDLEGFTKEECFAFAFSIQVGSNTKGEAVPLYTAEQLCEVEQQRDDLQALCRELVDALKDIRSYHSVMPDNVTNKSRIMATKADTAISKTEGKL